MSESGSLRLSDVRRVFRLVGDCRDLGHDSGLWMPRALAGLSQLVDARVVVGGFFTMPLADINQTRRSRWDVGWPDEATRARWLGVLATGRFTRYATVRRSMSQPGRLSVRSREQMISERAWSRSKERNEDRAPLDQDDTMIAVDWPGAGPMARVFSINRDVGQHRFNPRERRIVRLFSHEATLLAGSGLVHDQIGPIAALPRRLRQVLDALVEGDSAKQVAARLDLSRHTVNDYIKELHRRLAVGSRGELLAFVHRHQPAPPLQNGHG